MSYSALGSYTYGTGPCIALYANYDGTQIPGWVCPAPMQKTGHKPPRPRFCEGGPHQFQQALKLGGHYFGVVDGIVGPGTVAAIKSVTTKHGIAWNGDPWSVGPEICAAVIADALAGSPCSDPTKLKVGCAVRGYGPLDSYKSKPQALPSAPAPAPSSEGQTYAVIDPNVSRALTHRLISSSPEKTISSVAKVASRGVMTTSPPASSALATKQRSPIPQRDVEVPVTPQTPPELPPETSKKVPTWAYVAGGVAAIGGIGAIVMLRNKK